MKPWHLGRLCALLGFLAATPVDASTFSWTNAAGGKWSVAANWSPNAVPGTGDDAVISAAGSYSVTNDVASQTLRSVTFNASSATLLVSASTTLTTSSNLVFSAGTLTVAGALSSSGLIFSGGNLNGPGSVTLGGSNNWSGGNFNNPGSATVAVGANFYISGAANHFMTGWSLTNNGVILRAGTGAIVLGSGVAIRNTGLWLEQADGEINNNSGGASGLFSNTGTYRKTAGTGTSTIQFNVAFQNNGLVDIQSGNFGVNGGGTNAGVFNVGATSLCNFNSSCTFNAGAAFGGAGTNLLNSSIMTFNGVVACTNLQWGAATVAGNWAVPAGSTLYLVGSSGHSLGGTVITNAGTIIRTGGSVVFGSGSVVQNSGQWLDEVDSDFNNNLGGAASLFVNTGTFRKLASTNTTTFQGNIQLVNRGLLDVMSGALSITCAGTNTGSINIPTNSSCSFGGNYNFNTGTILNGPGALLFPSGTHNINGAIVATNLTLSGATLQGSGSLQLFGTNTWSGGESDVRGGGVVVSSNGVLVISGSGVHYSSAGLWTNNGTVIHTQGSITTGSGTAIWNNGLWLEQIDASFNNNSGGAASIFWNPGTFRKTAGPGNTVFQTALLFNNTGLLDIQSGTVSFSAGGTNSSTVNIGANGTCNFAGNYTFNSGSGFAGTGQIVFSSGIATLNSVLIVPGGSWTGGFAAGSGGVIFAGTNNWSSFEFDNTGGMTVPSGSTLLLTSTSQHSIYGVSWTNNGTVLHTGGSIQSGAGSRVWNNGLWLEQSDYAFYNGFGGAGSVFINNGILRKTAGAGATAFQSNFPLSNPGLVDIQSGTLSFQVAGTNSGTINTAAGAVCAFNNGFTFNAGSVLSGPGQVQFVSGTEVVNTVLNLTNAAWLGGLASGPGGIIFYGSNNWSSFEFDNTGGLTVPTGSTLVLSTTATHYIYGVTWTNNGTVLHTGGSLFSGAGCQVWNYGLWLEQADNTLYNGYGGNASVFVNLGTLRKTAGSGSSSFQSNFGLANTGLIDIASGTLAIQAGGTNSSTISIAAGSFCNFGGNYTFSAGAVFSGAGTPIFSSGTLTLRTVLTVPNGLWQGGLANGSGGVIFTGTNNWSSYEFDNTGGLTVPAGNTLLLTSAATHYIYGVAWTNSGVVSHSGGAVFSGAGCAIWNAGVWLEQTDNAIYNGYGGAVSTFYNQGVLRKNTTTGNSSFQSNFLLNNSGLIDVQTGTLTAQAGGTNSGTFNAAAGARGDFESGYTFNSGSVFSGGGSNTLSSGTMLFNGNIISTNLQWVGGAIVSGNFTLANGSTFYLIGSGNHDLPGATIVNYGNIIHTGGALRTGSASLIDNEGVWLEQADAVFNNSAYAGAASRFINHGTFSKTTTLGSSTFQAGVSFTNSHLLEVLSGTVSFAGGYSQSGATVRFGLSSTNNYGQMTVSGADALEGTLAVEFLNGYVPAGGDLFQPVGFTSHSGAFANFDLPPPPGGRNWRVEYGASGVLLRVVSPGTNNNLQITGNVADNHGAPIPGAVVYATIDPSRTTNLIQNGSFELPVVSGSFTLFSPGSTGIPGWTVTGPVGKTVAITSPSAGLSEDGSQFFDPTGNTGGAGISQSFATVVGRSYQLVFFHGTLTVHSLTSVLSVGIGTNSYTFGETAGNSGNYAWTQEIIPFIATTNQTTITFSDLTSADSNDNYVDNVQVLPGAFGAVYETVTDANGNYQLPAQDGYWLVGVDNLGALGFAAVANQNVFVNDNSPVVNFVTTPATAQNFNISATVNPVGAGTVTGTGLQPEGGTATLLATPSALPPYLFVNWTESGIFQSSSASYSFPVSRDRPLVANFILPLYALTATNNPAVGGSVTGAGSYFYGTTNVLTAHPNSGYLFGNWTVGGTVVGTNLTLSVVLYSNQTVVANYNDANVFHTVATATAPPGLAVVAGAGTYTNGQTAIFVAPASLTNPPIVYTFKQFTLSNTVASGTASFNKTFTTLDQTNLYYVAVYNSRSLSPVVTNVILSPANPVPATTNFVLQIQFDRTMNTNVTPVVRLTNSAVSAIQPVVPASRGLWSSLVLTNDTYSTPRITFSPGMDGTNQVFVSGAADPQGNGLATTNVASVLVDATPPLTPVLSVTASNSSSITVSWTAYPAPADLSTFRVYLQTTNYTSVAGLPILNGLASSVRSFQFNGLALDTKYYVAVQAVDIAGNATTSIVPQLIKLPSTIPPKVTIQEGAVAASSALLTWSNYSTANLLGFAGFKVYYEVTNFTSVSNLTPRLTLGTAAQSIQIDGLNRSNIYHFAVVGFNGIGGFNSNVSTAAWSDPYAGNISVNHTIGGAGQSVVAINSSIVVVSNAVVTIPAGTTLQFAPGTSLTVLTGKLVALGTPLQPIILTSANDVPGGAPAPGDWGGVLLLSGAGASTLSQVQIVYGAGLTISNCSPAVDAFTALQNTPNGLLLKGGARLSTTNALLAANTVGVGQMDTAVLTILNSVIQNNGSNAVNSGLAALAVLSNWWGIAVQSNIQATVSGNVTLIPFLNYEPVLTPALGTLNNVTQVGGGVVNLQLACRTADSMRLSEDSSFAGVFFQPFTNAFTFPLSVGGGLKTIYAQYRSVTGQTNSPLSVTVNYITAGPVIQSFSLSEGQTLSRPLTVTGSATAILGMLDLELYVDGVLQSTNAGGSFSQFLDISTLGNAIHRVELLARDTSGNLATLSVNVVVALTPPVAPVITVPASDYLTNQAVLTVGGTAEPNINIQVTRNGQVVGVTNAGVTGSFSFTNVTLVEGANTIVAVASDGSGSTPSSARRMILSTMLPVAVVLNPPSYQVGIGLSLSWMFAPTGKRATSFQVFWATSSFTQTNQATGRSLVLRNLGYTAQGLANGTYYFGVVGYDDAGNASPLSALVNTAYDTTPPALNLAFSPLSPVGPGPVSFILTSSEALAAAPSLTIQPAGSGSPVLLSLTNTALNTYQSVFQVSTSTPSGPVIVAASAQDLAGNVFMGTPSGSALVIDTVPPMGNLTTTPSGPVQVTNSTPVAVHLVLSKSAAISPVLTYAAPAGTNVPIALVGSGSNWNGTLPLDSTFGSGVGIFFLGAQDALGNLGTNLATGRTLEIYNTPLPPPPVAPTSLLATTLSGGRIQLAWGAVTNAQVYRLYRQAGATNTTVTTLDQDNLSTNVVIDLPPADGAYTYGVSALRLGAESGVSNLVVGVSDRTPPLAPTNVLASLPASGVRITWGEPFIGEVPDHYNVYRNGTLIQTVGGITPVIDYPPRGTNSYAVSAVDAAGNENLSTPSVIQLLVGPVNNLSVVVASGQAPTLNWSSTDATAVGFNLYRNGVKQNSALLNQNNYHDNLPLSGMVQYAVTAVNAAAQESPQRVVTVYPLAFSLLANAQGGTTNNPLSTGYFDTLQVGITNLSNQAFPFAQVQLTRTGVDLSPLSMTQAVNGNLNGGANSQRMFVFPELQSAASQTFQVSVSQTTDSPGSTIVYQQSFTPGYAPLIAPEIVVSANQLPLAGGLSSIQVQLFNRGYADMDVVVLRQGGKAPGDVAVAVVNSLGQEVSRTGFQGAPVGTFGLPDGSAFVRIKAGSSISFPVANVFVPAALAGATNTMFVAVVSNIYYQLPVSKAIASGPLTGSMVSSLAQTPYYGTAQTDQMGYANTQPIHISGQALDRVTGLPVANAALNIGFATRGYKWYVPVTTDAAGNYQYTYNPAPGFGGTLTLWAAHPQVVDQLNQVQVTLYVLYAGPASGDVRMSKNDTQDFSIQLINPGDVPLTGFTTSFSVYQLSGTNHLPVTTITGTNLAGPGFTVGPGKRQTVNLRLTAAFNAPDLAECVFTFTSAEGAMATFTGSLSLLPAIPVLNVTIPAAGYLEVSLNRGDQKRGQITVMNSGLKSLQGITVQPPTNINWMVVNLPVSSDGMMHLPDLEVGQSNSFSVVFTPPGTTPLNYYQDTLTINGTNAVSGFTMNVYALVTSDLTGGVQFEVDDILGQQVPHALIHLRNRLLQAELPAFFTDTNGFVTVTNLQEGAWDWQVTAPGCSVNAGAVMVVADQTVYQHTRLARSLVTVNFNVVPVPFTDKYDIKIEQTFETHVPAGVLVVDPPFVDLKTVPSTFDTNFIVHVQNFGLIQMNDVVINGSQANGAAYTPLITYIPVLFPMQTVDVPFNFSYQQPGAGGTNSGGHMSIRQDSISYMDLTNNLVGCVSGAAPVFGNFIDPSLFLSLAAILNAEERCFKDDRVQAVTASALIIGAVLLATSGSSSEEFLGNTILSFVQCVVGNFLAYFGIGFFGSGGHDVPVDPFGPADSGTTRSGMGYGQVGGCFTADTLVLTADGTSKPISAIKVGDVVQSGVRNGVHAVVNATYRMEGARVREIHFADLRHPEGGRLETTDEHLFWVDGKGWLAAARLAVGDWLFNSRGERIQILEVHTLSQPATVYTLSLGGDNAFYANGILVHDLCGAPPPSLTVTGKEGRR